MNNDVTSSDGPRLTARAITMWDFSWLERRWPGAGFEDWDQALAELVDRGYDSVRIDAYPHLISADPYKTWTLLPRWTTQDWGAPAKVEVQVLPELIDFIRACDRHEVDVALSSWFRRDIDDVRMRLDTPEKLAEAWNRTLEAIAEAGLMHRILWVDLCNEFPLPFWAPFVYGGEDGVEPLPIEDPQIQRWMRDSIAVVRSSHPELPLTFSLSNLVEELERADVSCLDLLEPHLWLAGATDYYDKIGYAYEQFDGAGYENVVAKGRSYYFENRTRLDREFVTEIERAAEWSRRAGKPLAITECWALVDYKDWPGLEWDWIKQINEWAVRQAAATGRWTFLATSNFCAPQFVGMWRDVAYHRRLTDLIHASTVDPELA